MEDTIAQRLKTFRVSLGLTQEEFGVKCGISQRTYANLENGKTRKVSADYLNQIEAAHPTLSPKWLRMGVGSMLREAQPFMAISAAEEPLAPFAATAPPIANPDVVTAFLGQMAEMARNHRDEVQALKKEARKDLRAQAEHYDYTIRRISEDFALERAELKARIFDLELRAGLRQPTAAELELMEKQAAPRAKKPGFKNYDEEQPVSEEAVMTVSHSNPDFIRPLPLEKEVSHLQAA